MQRNTLFSILATAALGLVMAGPVSADTTDWVSGDATNPERWHEDNNWSNGIPVAGDTVNIKLLTQPDGYRDPVLSTADGAAGTLKIRNGFTLTVTGVKLTLDGTTTHDIDGELRLSNNTAVVKFSASVTAGGDGAIVGQHNDAEIQIADGVTFTNNVDIVGQMTIKESGTSGTFHNGSTGIVRANGTATAPAILVFAAGLTLTDENGASYEAKTDPDAVLQFKQAANLAGDFVLCADATLDFDAAIDTTGCFDETIANGWVRVAGTNFFCHDDSNCAAGGGEAKCYSSDTEFTGSCND